MKCVDTVMIKGSVLTGQTVKLVTGNEFSKRDWVFAGVGRSIIYRFPRSICSEGGGGLTKTFAEIFMNVICDMETVEGDLCKPHAFTSFYG